MYLNSKIIIIFVLYQCLMICSSQTENPEKQKQHATSKSNGNDYSILASKQNASRTGMKRPYYYNRRANVKNTNGTKFNLNRKMNTEVSKNSTNTTQEINDPKNNIVWFDGEMTGLNPNEHTFVEAAIIVTDGDLNVLAESENIIIYQPDDVLNNMEPWPKRHHALSGLTARVKKSKISIEQADQILYDFIEPFTPKGSCPLAGNTIYMDRMFIRNYFPKVESHLSYRLIDVSTFKELFRRWKPEVANEAPKKQFKHRALDDIRESLEELKYYRNHINIS